MRFDVAFNGKRWLKMDIDSNLLSTSEIKVPIWDIADMIESICDDLDMVRPQDMEILKEAIDRFNYLTKVED